MEKGARSFVGENLKKQANFRGRKIANYNTPFTRYNRLSNQFVKPVVGCRFDNRLDVCLHDTAGCQTSCTTGLTNTVWQPCWMNSCSFSLLSNRVVQRYNRFDNRLYTRYSRLSNPRL